MNRDGYVEQSRVDLAPDGSPIMGRPERYAHLIADLLGRRTVVTACGLALVASIDYAPRLVMRSALPPCPRCQRRTADD